MTVWFLLTAVVAAICVRLTVNNDPRDGDKGSSNEPEPTDADETEPTEENSAAAALTQESSAGANEQEASYIPYAERGLTVSGIMALSDEDIDNWIEETEQEMNELERQRKERGPTPLDDLDPDFVQELVDNYTPDPNDEGMVVLRTLQSNAERLIVRLKADPYSDSEQQMKSLKKQESSLAEIKKLQEQLIRNRAVFGYLRENRRRKIQRPQH
ncbi:MAG: hypothetical protein OXT69_00520 [Candidatus Poribacteria bacterium]|nr:hypothetical protein [Candidatus Poribacteria bacterium]